MDTGSEIDRRFDVKAAQRHIHQACPDFTFDGGGTVTCLNALDGRHVVNLRGESWLFP
jgi:hypothetical protein